MRIRLSCQKLIQIALAITVFNLVCCSYGDRLGKFRKCLEAKESQCHGKSYPAVLPWHLRIFGWTCLDELKYQCMHSTTQWLLALGDSVCQFYGKWPFVRFLGIQEPASTIFSLGNLAAHVFGWRLFSKAVSEEYPFYQPTKLYFLVSVNAWIWSSVFHTRDLDITEKLDYFCASLVIISSIYFCFARIIGDPWDKRCFLFGSFMAVVYAHHVYTMGFIKFDYGYNMKFNVFIGTLNLIMWLCWWFLQRRMRPYAWKCAAIVTTVYLCVGLEVFDFPPIWWTFDAHSLWHLATIPLSYLWYNFLIDDGKHELSLIKRL